MTRHSEALKLMNLMAGPNNNVHLMKTHYSSDWRCSYDHDSPGLKVELVATGPTPEEAIEECYKRFNQAGEGIKEVRPLTIEHKPPPVKIYDVNDEVPF